jgi:predicted O-linked N-acetylglucosamine transferase (SPINDLY family)
LVYPGTSGAPFLDYLVADSIVVPPEHANHYSESLLLLPPSYQISYFERHIFNDSDNKEDDDRVDSYNGDDSNVYDNNDNNNNDNNNNNNNNNDSNNKDIEYDQNIEKIPQKKKFQNDIKKKYELRKLYNLPLGESDIVLCNFNKIDKLDLPTFALWMIIMRQVPNSYLWLLKPSKSRGEGDTFHAKDHNNLVERRLQSAAAAEGINPHRIIFAEREKKTMHIIRHYAADLFLDSLVYGAHSTATDALRGGLPVLTIRGDSFPNRVVNMNIYIHVFMYVYTCIHVFICVFIFIGIYIFMYI